MYETKENKIIDQNITAVKQRWWKSDLLGIPDTSLRGLSTLTARSVRRSKSEPTVAKILYVDTDTNMQ